ncbi:MAG TPA: glycosyltransferase family 4 protein [Bacteroidales bacterium]|nr:glycosyltransferase family 4 protein [Bacteroidales bacterium]
MNQYSKHILFLPAWYPHKNDSMTGLFVKNHAKAISLYHKVTVIHALQDTALQKRFEIEQTDKNGFTEILIYYKKNTLPIPLINTILRIFRFRKAIYLGIKQIENKQQIPDIIHVHILTRYGIMGYLLSKRWKIPFVITEHWSRYLPERNTYKGLLRKLITKKIVRKASAVMPVSKILMQAMQYHHLYNSVYKVIPNTVNTSIFVPFTEDKSSPPFRFIHVSCFDNAIKNITGIIDAYKLLLKTEHSVELILAGDGPDYDMVKKYAAETGLASKITFTGLLEEKALANVIAKSNSMVIFSNFETFSVVAAESLSCSVPVIATRVGAIPELINEERGILIEPGNIKLLYNAMCQMIHNYPHYNLEKIRTFAVQKFSVQVVAKQFDSIYNQILGNV